MYKQYLINLGLPPKDENFVGGMPVTLDKNCLSQILRKVNDQYDYHMTLKVDGERFLCCIMDDNLVFLDRNLLSYYLFSGEIPINAKTTPCILDGELYKDPRTGITYAFIFDCILDNDKPVYKNNYLARYQSLGKRCDELNNLLALQGVRDFVFHSEALV